MLRWNFLLHSCEYKWLRHKCRRILKMLSLQLCDIFLQHYVISKIWLIKPFIIFHLKKIFIILNIQYITSLKKFLGSMLPQYMAFSVSQFRQCVKKNLCVRSLGYIVGASSPSVKICVSVRWVTLWVHPPDIVDKRRSDYCPRGAIFGGQCC